MHLLVVDPAAEPGLVEELAEQRLRVAVVDSPLAGLVALGRWQPRAVVVTPYDGPLSACVFITEVRRHASPLIVAALDARDSTEAGALLLAGATAAVTRPYSAATLWPVLHSAVGAPAEELALSCGPIEVDRQTYTVRIDGRAVSDLPLKEFELLCALVREAPRVVGNDELRAWLWGRGQTASDNTIAVHVARLRHRLGDAARIRRLRGRGYALVVP